MFIFFFKLDERSAVYTDDRMVRLKREPIVCNQITILLEKNTKKNKKDFFASMAQSVSAFDCYNMAHYMYVISHREVVSSSLTGSV